MAQTIRQVIENLSSYEDKDKSILFVYWVSEDIEPSVSNEVFAEAVDIVQGYDNLWDEPTELLAEQIAKLQEDN
jgi:hypothetical protein